MTELSFLVGLLLEYKLPPKAREAVRARIREVEAQTIVRQPAQYPGMVNPVTGPSALPPDIARQAPSMQAIMMKHPDLVQERIVQVNETYGVAPNPVAVIAQTPQTAAAMASRQQAISEAISGKIEKGRTSPRKF